MVEGGVEPVAQTAELTTSGLLALVFAVFATAMLMFVRRNPLSYVSSFVRALYRHTLGHLFAALGKLTGFRRKPHLPPVRRGGATFATLIARAFASDTMVDRQLAIVANNPRYDLGKQGGFFFSWLRPEGNCLPRVEQYTLDRALRDAEMSHRVFHFNLPIREILTLNQTIVTDEEHGHFETLRHHEYMYEDVHSSLIIRLFRGDEGPRLGINDPEDGEPSEQVLPPLEVGPDDVYYHVINAMRKIINDNTRRLASILSLIMAVNVLIVMYCEDLINLLGVTPAEDISLDLAFTVLQFNPTHTVVVGATTLSALFLMGIVYGFEYTYVQRNNGREVDAYVKAYLAFLNSRFREADAAVKEAIGGNPEGSESEDVRRRDQSSIWFVNMHWIGWRCFFVEWYLRSVFYQIIRNTSYYMSLIPLAFGLAISVAIVAIDDNLVGRLMGVPIPYWFALAITFIVYLRCLNRSGTLVSEGIDEENWIEFHKLRLEETTVSIVNRFLREISNWRDRYRRGDGGG